MARPTASNINETGVNKEYPVAGQDNDSQGFRDNFTIISDNFVAAKAEIKDLMDNTARLEIANNFLGNTIQNANLIDVSEGYFAGGTVNTSQNINYSNGGYQTFTVGADVTLTLSEWPENNKAGKIRIYINNDGSQRTVTFASNAGAGTFKRISTWPNAGNTAVIDTPSARVYAFDFVSYDNGATVFADYIGYFE
tara:strand:- start:1168 stop:1752 length:585 start_codon:yes stop_codon:yes gene_type:complete